MLHSLSEPNLSVLLKHEHRARLNTLARAKPKGLGLCI